MVGNSTFVHQKEVRSWIVPFSVALTPSHRAVCCSDPGICVILSNEVILSHAVMKIYQFLNYLISSALKYVAI